MAKEIKESIVAPATVEEPVYDAAEIAANAQHLFGYNADIATAALDFNHVTRCSREKAKELIKDFAERKVD